MDLTVTVPLNNGDGSIAKFTLQLPAGAPAAPATSIAWSSGTTGTGTVAASNDGQSALFTPVAAGSTLITATITTGPSGVISPWAPGKLYRLGDQILDSNKHIQQVTAATKQVPTRFTPYAGKVPGSASLVLTSGSAAYTAPTGFPASGGSVAITGITASVPATFVVGQLVTIGGMSGALASLNGVWTLLAVGANSITISYNGASVSGTVTAASTAAVIGDANSLDEDYTGTSGALNGSAQYGTVLNQGDGTNGDWPAGATAAISGNILAPLPTSAATVAWIAAGYSSGRNIAGQDNGPAGIDSPAPIVPWQQGYAYPVGFVIVDEGGFFQKVRNGGTSGTQYPAFNETPTGTTTDNGVIWLNIGAAAPGYTNNESFVHHATYSEIGADGYIEYYDQAGNVQSHGWVIEEGTVVFAEPNGQPPAFSTSGGTTLDGDLTWTDEGTGSNVVTTYNNLTITVSTAAGVQPVPYNYQVIQ